MVRSLGMGGMSSGPRNGRFRIDRRRKRARRRYLVNAEPQTRKFNQAGGLGTIVNATHFPLGQVAAGIVALVVNSLLDQRGHLQPLQ